MTSTGHGGAMPGEPASTPDTPLRYGTAADAGLDEQHIDRLARAARHGSDPGTGDDGHPQYPGGVVLAARRGVVAVHDAWGQALRYADREGAELPRERWIATARDTIFDLASLSKLFTTIMAMQLVDRGQLDLDATVASYLPPFAQGSKEAITVRHLLTHTSGLPEEPQPPLWTLPGREEQAAALHATPLRAAPGSTHRYSDVNLITVQLVIEAVTGRTLDMLLRDGLTGPLGMADTMYAPAAALRPRIAATEYQAAPDRGLVWGEVHDENAWALGGVAGHAGVFSTAYDLAVLCQMIMNGGSYDGVRVLSRDAVAAMTTHDVRLPGPVGLGFEIDAPRYMGALAGPCTAGHTGFTGTSLVIDPTRDAFVVLLTNRVHPSRTWGSVHPSRVAVADALADAVPASPGRSRPPLRWRSAGSTSVGSRPPLR